MSEDKPSADYDRGAITPEGQARLDKYGSTLDAYNVESVCKRIADYPEILAAAARVLAERFRENAGTPVAPGCPAAADRAFWNRAADALTACADCKCGWLRDPSEPHAGYCPLASANGDAR